MQLTYQKLGKDHPKFGQVEFLVADGMTPICYKTKDGYLPLEEGAAPVAAQEATKPVVETRPLYVMSFKVNGEKEELTFGSKKKLDKAKANFEEKPFITDFEVKEFQVVR